MPNNIHSAVGVSLCTAHTTTTHLHIRAGNLVSYIQTLCDSCLAIHSDGFKLVCYLPTKVQHTSWSCPHTQPYNLCHILSVDPHIQVLHNGSCNWICTLISLASAYTHHTPQSHTEHKPQRTFPPVPLYSNTTHAAVMMDSAGFEFLGPVVQRDEVETEPAVGEASSTVHRGQHQGEEGQTVGQPQVGVYKAVVCLQGHHTQHVQTF